MNLIPFSKQYLRLNESLPFGIRDSGGRLLLAAGARIDRPAMLAELQAGELFADEAESSDWRRRLAGAMDMMILKNASLGKIVEARPDQQEREATGARELGFIEQWGEMAVVLDSAMRDMRPDTAWMARLMAVNDRVLRNIIVGLGGKMDGITRQTGFDITAASEVMAILALSTSLEDMRARLGRIVVGYNGAGEPVTAEQLKGAGSMAVIMKEALKPNLLQTLENTPVIVHAGPFGNIAHGNSSIVGDLIGIRGGDYLITEAGFGADMGAERCCRWPCSGSWPRDWSPGCASPGPRRVGPWCARCAGGSPGDTCGRCRSCWRQ